MELCTIVSLFHHSIHTDVREQRGRERRRRRGRADGLLDSGTAAICVLGQQGHAAEGLAARRTGILFHVRMRLQMRPQIRSVGKGPLAMLAVEGLLARVRPDVALQQPRPRESLSADVALAGQRMGADVHLKGAQRHVHFVTVLAAERLLRLVSLGGGAMELLVLGQATERRVRLSAIGALIAGHVSVGGFLLFGRLAAGLVLDVGRLLAQRQTAGRRSLARQVLGHGVSRRGDRRGHGEAGVGEHRVE